MILLDDGTNLTADTPINASTEIIVSKLLPFKNKMTSDTDKKITTIN